MENQTIFKGIITEYNSERGFGFITDKDGDSSYFFHISNVDKSLKIIPNRTEVTFKLTETPKGLQATNIRAYIEKIEGEFANVDLPNHKFSKSNADRLSFLEQQQEIIYKVLNTLEECGIAIKEEKNGWINLDLYEIDELSNIVVDGGNYNRVPNGYPKTFEHLIRLLQKQINDFNYDLINTKKGISGEEKTLNSLKALTVSYPILNNVRLEEDIKNSNEKYSAETDLIAITDRAIFLIETKNYGGKGDSLIITTDGRWILKDKYTKKEHTLSNPFKQITDHTFVVNKFLENNNIKFNLPIIPIIALANNNLILQIDDKNSLYAKVMSADLVGSYILNYHNENKAIIKLKDIDAVKKLLDEKSLPPKTYQVLDYCKNILKVCESILELLKMYKHDNDIFTEAERIQKEKEEKTDRILEGIGTAIGLIGVLLDL